MNNLLKGSWRTTLLGFFVIALSISKFAVANLDGDPATVYPWADLSAAVLGGWALMLARDNKVSSEEACAAPPPPTRPKIGLLGFVLVCALFSTGCARFVGRTAREYEGTNVVSEVTRFSGYTFLDGKATLSKAKSMQTSKTQSIGVDASMQETTGKTVSEIGGKIIDRVIIP